ncbi:MAG: hypothetical protein Q9170_001338 [Blastenia crenularia]
METDASTALPPPGVDNSNHHSRRRLRSPVPALANYIRQSHRSTGTISQVLSLANLKGFTNRCRLYRFPQPLLAASATFLKTSPQPTLTATHITILVGALDDGTPNICGRLDDAAFPTIGCLAMELLRDCRDNRDLLSVRDLASLRQSLGESVIHGNDESLRLIAGTIIREMVEYGASIREFWSPDRFPDPPAIFGVDLEHPSQWAAEFVGFVDELETQGFLTQRRSTSTFAYAVYVDGVVYNTKTGMSILVTLNDNLVIVIPSTEAQMAQYIDIPLEHVESIQLEKGELETQPGFVSRPLTTVLLFHLADTADISYFVNEVGHRPGQIILAFDTLADAISIKEQLEAASETPRGRKAEEMGEAVKVGPEVPNSNQQVEVLSQSACIDISNHSSQGDFPKPQAIIGFNNATSESLVAMASEAQGSLAISTKNKPKSGARNAQQEITATNGINRPHTNAILVATDVLDVRQEFRQDEVLGYQRSRSADTSGLEPTNSRTWRSGLRILDNAKEFRPKQPPVPAFPEPYQSNPRTASHAGETPDDDLYSATPPGAKSKASQPIQDGSFQASKQIQPQIVASMKSSTTSSRKLSRSINVGDEEQSSTYPLTNLGRGQSTIRDQDHSIQKPSSVATQAGSSKRKPLAKEKDGPTKKQKTNNMVTDGSAAGKPTVSAGKKYVDNGDYEIPATPPSPQQAMRKPKVPAKKKPRTIDHKAKSRSSKRVDRSADAQPLNMKNLNKEKDPCSAKAAGKSQVNGLNKTVSDQEMEVTMNDIVDAGIKSNNAKPSKKQPGKVKTNATANGKITTSRQPAKAATKVSTTIKEGQSPKKPRAAKEAARRRIQAMESDNIDPDDVLINGGTSDGQSLVTEEPQASLHPTKRSLGDNNEIPDSYEIHASSEGRSSTIVTIASRPSVNRVDPNSGDSIGSDKSGPPAESPIRTAHLSNDQSANQRPRLLEKVKGYIVEPVTLVHSEVGCQDALSGFPLARTAISSGEGGEGAQQVLDNSHQENVNLKPAEVHPEIQGLLYNGKSPLISENNGMQPTAEDSHFEDAIAPSMLETISPFAGDLETAKKYDVGFDPDVGAGSKTDPDAEKRDHVTIWCRSAVLSETGQPPEKSEVAREAHGHVMNPTGLQVASRDSPEQRDRPLLQPPKSHSSDQLSIFASADPKTSYAAKFDHHETSGELAVDGTSRGPLRPVHRLSNPTLHQGVPRLKAATEFANASQPSSPNEGTLIIPIQQHDGKNISEHTYGNDARQLDAKADNETNKRVPPISRQVGPADAAPLMLEITSKDEEQKVSDVSIYAKSINTGDGVATTNISDGFVAKPPQEHSHKISALPIGEYAAQKRPQDLLDRHQYKKRRLLPQDDQRSRPNTPSSRVRKDPGRIPQIIGFSAKGPRNQGTAFLEFVAKAQPQLADHRADKTTLTPTTLDLEDDAALAHNKISSLQPRSDVLRQPRSRTREPIPEHSSLFVEDPLPKFSSQNSRVTENGSPMPIQRTLTHRITVQEPENLRLQPLQEDDIDALTDDEDETTFVHLPEDKSPEMELPRHPLSRAVRVKHVGFVESSNSKQGPSSPSAPSVMLTEAEAHTIKPDGKLVNMVTEKVVVPSNPQDPFANTNARSSNGFLAKLRRASEHKHSHTVAEKPEAPKKPRSTRPTAADDDPDKTLVEGFRGQHGKENQASPTETSTSSTSSSDQQSRSSQDSNIFAAFAKRWGDALEPHQENMLTVLYEISHALFGHLMDAETAVNDVVKDYQNRGQRMLQKLSEDLQAGFEEYASTADARRDEMMKELESLHAKIMKNLQRKPKAEALAAQLEQRQRDINEQMEAALQLCEEGAV